MWSFGWSWSAPEWRHTELMNANALAVEVPPGLFVFDYDEARRLCVEQGHSYSKLAALSGKGYYSVRNYLIGDADPPAGWVGALSMILGVTPECLYRLAEPQDLSGAVEVRPMGVQVKSISRRRRLARRSEMAP